MDFGLRGPRQSNDAAVTDWIHGLQRTMMSSSGIGLQMITVPSVRQRFFQALITFVIVLIVGYGSDVLLVGHPGWIVVDDVTLALIAAILVYQYERERSDLLEEKLRVIRDMNAYVRNELQVLYASLEAPKEQSMQTIQRSVERIDWALRELLPGRHAVQRDSAESPHRDRSQNIQ